MMQEKKIIAGALAGTSAMALFSYLISHAKEKDFREPEILAELLKRLAKGSKPPVTSIAGWSMHYAIGLLFVAMYSQVWKKNIVKPHLLSGFALGAPSALLGIMAWKIIFEMHPDPPLKNLKKYFGHLFAAHLIFGAFAALGYKNTAPAKAPQISGN
jgi:hypothetical protein